MCVLYVCEQGAVVRFKENRYEIKKSDHVIESIPAESIEKISIYGNIQLTAKCIHECLKRNIDVIFYSKMATYYGKLVHFYSQNAKLQKQQVTLSEENSFLIPFCKSIISAKINNQIVLIRRYSRTKKNDMSFYINQMNICKEKIWSFSVNSVEKIMGYEGIAAKFYFCAISKIIDDVFKFNGRTKRPPKDPFNSLISLGYTIVMHEIIGKLEGRGINPFFGFMHKDKTNHPALASDLLEEWRSILVDSVALSLINGHEICINNFYKSDKNNGIYVNNDGFKTFVKKIENKLNSKVKYLKDYSKAVSFRHIINMQVESLVKSIRDNNPDNYKPILIR